MTGWASLKGILGGGGLERSEEKDWCFVTPSRLVRTLRKREETHSGGEKGTEDTKISSIKD